MPRKCPLNTLTNEKLNGPLSPFINPGLEEIMVEVQKEEDFVRRETRGSVEGME